MKNVVLIGFMGTGKTSVGKILAGKLGFAFADIDKKIEEEYSMTIADMFINKGESYFRSVEQQMVKRLAARKNTVIATGGGAVANAENMKALRENGLIVCLKANVDSIKARTEGNDNRPLLMALTDEERTKKIEELLATRAEFYDQADYTVDTSELSPMQVADDIARFCLKNKNRRKTNSHENS